MSGFGWAELAVIGWTLLAVLAVVLLVALVFVSWLLTLLGLPGNWIVLLLAALYAWVIPNTWRCDIGPKWVIALVVLAVIGEAVEFLAGALGTQQAGGSRRSAIGALVGSMVGGIVGATVALPVPLIGPVIGALVVGGVGAAIGAVVGELSAGGQANRSWQIGQAAFWGRLLGTGGKTLVGAVMVAAVVVALVL